MVDRGDDPAPALAAALRDLPTVRPDPRRVHQGRLAGGPPQSRPRGTAAGQDSPLPCALLVAGDAREVSYPPLEAVMASLEGDGRRSWGLPELGLPEHAIGKAGSYLEAGRFVTPPARPDPGGDP